MNGIKRKADERHKGRRGRGEEEEEALLIIQRLRL
jgi:hypothetical protein